MVHVIADGRKTNMFRDTGKSYRKDFKWVRRRYLLNLLREMWLTKYSFQADDEVRNPVKSKIKRHVLEGSVMDNKEPIGNCHAKSTTKFQLQMWSHKLLGFLARVDGLGRWTGSGHF
jgi:hypothetical protein